MENNLDALKEFAQEEKPERVYTEFEQQQMKAGWNPNGRKSAEEWAANEPLAKENAARGREITQLRKAVDHLKDIMVKQEKATYEKALKEIEQQRREAIKAGDVDRVEQLDEDKQKLKPTENAPEKSQVFQSFFENNRNWLEGDSDEELEMFQWARGRERILLDRGLSHDEVFAKLDEAVRKKFPDYFGLDTKKTAPVESSGSVYGKAQSNNLSVNDLNDTEKEMMDLFVRTGMSTKKEYLEMIAKTRLDNEKR